MRSEWRASLRVVERQTKALIIRVLGRLVRARDPGPPPDWRAGPHRILYLRYDRIGDMVLATGIIKAIAAAQPTVAVDVLASRANAAVLRGNPHVGAVVTIDRKRWWTYVPAMARVRRARYDAVVDAMVMAPSLTTMLLMWASGARHRIGVADRGNQFALTMPVPRVPNAEHYVDHSAAVLAAFGIDPAEVRRLASSRGAPQTPPEAPTSAVGNTGGGWGIWLPELFLTADELREGDARWQAAAAPRGRQVGTPLRLVVNVSAGAGWRYWPDDRFIAVITRTRARFPDVVTLVIGSPEDAKRMKEIGDAAGVQVAHTASYRQMMAIVATGDVALTADTSVTHIASAFGKPAVAMFARSRGSLYGPYGTAGRVVSTADLSLESLDVDPVVEALESVIETVAAGR